MADVQRQYLRTIQLLVSGDSLSDDIALSKSQPLEPGLDLSKLRIKFSVKRSQQMTPNTADIRIYNVEAKTANKILLLQNPGGRGRVILQAGYESNFGVIFQGNIKQVILGRESATDTFVDIVAGDGDHAYNFSVVRTSLAAGSTQNEQVTAAMNAMNSKGVTIGHVSDLPNEKLPRGKVMYGNSRNYLRDTAQTSGQSWSIQDGKVNFVSNTGYLPGQAVVLNSKSGMIGTPQQTNEGVNVKCLLNPSIKIGGLIKIDNASVERFKINLDTPNSPANIPAPLNADGVYYSLVIEHTGDTRAVDWYTSLICLNVDVSANPRNAVQVNYG